MSRPRINWIEIVCFRAFGATPQRITFTTDLECIWGPNSQGKTSLAEAVEFLFTGKTSRRDMVGSSVEEFADSLRNAHLAIGVSTYVMAEVVATDGSNHAVRRTLVTDYGRRNDCQSRLEIDGVTADVSVLQSLGIVAGSGPISSHVLMQHTMTYLLSARPTDRAAFFRAVLDVMDLEELRRTLDGLDANLVEPTTDELNKLRSVAAVAELDPILTPLFSSTVTVAQIELRLDQAITMILAGVGEAIAPTPVERRVALKRRLEVEQDRTFRLGGFDRSELTQWRPVGNDLSRLESYVEHRNRISAEALRVADALRATLQIPSIANAPGPVDCPVCETHDALTPARVAVIREVLQRTTEAQSAQTLASESAVSIRNIIRAVPENVNDAVPRALRAQSVQRRSGGFRCDRMRALLSLTEHPLITEWLAGLRDLLRARRRLLRACSISQQLIDPIATDIHTLTTVQPLRDALQQLRGAHDSFVAAQRAYVQSAEPLIAAIRAAVDQRSETTGWQELLHLSENAEKLQRSLGDLAAVRQVRNEFQEAINAIDEARGTILDENFQVLNDTIVQWWELLRPGEPSFFQGVARRAGAIRTIDF